MKKKNIKINLFPKNKFKNKMNKKSKLKTKTI